MAIPSKAAFLNYTFLESLFIGLLKVLIEQSDYKGLLVMKH